MFRWHGSDHNAKNRIPLDHPRPLGLLDSVTRRPSMDSGRDNAEVFLTTFWPARRKMVYIGVPENLLASRLREQTSTFPHR